MSHHQSGNCHTLMRISGKSLFFSALTMTLMICGCKTDNSEALKQLYGQYENGEIAACKHLGSTVYLAQINAFDAPSIVYDGDGMRIGSCNYAWRQVEAICQELKACKTIYRCRDHISRKPPIDKLRLAKDKNT